ANLLAAPTTKESNVYFGFNMFLVVLGVDVWGAFSLFSLSNGSLSSSSDCNLTSNSDPVISYNKALTISVYLLTSQFLIKSFSTLIVRISLLKSLTYVLLSQVS